jgi:SAM-dependent methyltransferase
MNDYGSRFWQIFFEVYENLPRQGPGSRDCTERALRLCVGLPPAPMIADLGCGVGRQTLDLADLTTGAIIAIDSHPPFIERLRATLVAHGLEQRVQAQVGDMAHLDLPPERYDLVWSEGALYNLGIGKALQVCRVLLRPGGFLAFTEAVWRKPDPPPEVKASFDLDYPTMGTVGEVISAIQLGGFELLGHFTLSDEAWWDDFLLPMEQRIMNLRQKYANDTEALAVLDQLAREPEMHRRYSDYYAYEFFVMRRPTTT